MEKLGKIAAETDQCRQRWGQSLVGRFRGSGSAVGAVQVLTSYVIGSIHDCKPTYLFTQSSDREYYQRLGGNEVQSEERSRRRGNTPRCRRSPTGS